MKVKVSSDKKTTKSGKNLPLLKNSFNKIHCHLNEAISSDFKEHDFVEINNKLHGKSKIIFRTKN